LTKLKDRVMTDAKIEDPVNVVTLRDLLASLGFNQTETLAIQTELYLKNPKKTVLIAKSELDKVLSVAQAKPPQPPSPKKPHEHLDEDELLDGWDQDFDVKQSKPPQKQAEDDLMVDDNDPNDPLNDFENDFDEAQLTVSKPSPQKVPVKSSKKTDPLDDYIGDEF
jgi:hypothetical protein